MRSGSENDSARIFVGTRSRSVAVIWFGHVQANRYGRLEENAIFAVTTIEMRPFRNGWLPSAAVFRAALRGIGDVKINGRWHRSKLGGRFPKHEHGISNSALGDHFSGSIDRQERGRLSKNALPVTGDNG
jgi:hypothetical protein